MFGEDCEPTLGLRIRRSSESSTVDCPRSKLSDVFGPHNWPDSLRGLAAIYRKLVEQSDDSFINDELVELASVCEQVADNIEDHLAGGEDHAPRGPWSRLS